MLRELTTPRGEALSGTPWTAYPRPRMRRDSYVNLNGEWDFAVGEPTFGERKILVPFCPESRLSGIGEHFSEGAQLWYRRSFILPEGFCRGRVLLHFGAADQTAEVFVNGEKVGFHEGGYLPFSCDITHALQPENVLTVCCRDDLRDSSFPYGKQVMERGGMWYTPVSGIWQTVWLERVPERYIRSLTITPDLTGADIAVEGVENFTVTLDGREYRFDGNTGRIDLPAPHLWTPDDPHLYPITVTAGEDRVESYFALRTISVEEKGSVNRVCLNGQPIFLHGVLDQGYFPDGLFLPADPAEYERDILRMKALGYNLLRKHIKVEPEYFYYACDRLGMLVMQDMVNSGDYSFLRDTALPTLGVKRLRDDRGNVDGRKEFFLHHMEDTARRLYNHPCVVAWTIFNEGWGQFDADKAYDRLKALDPTRLIDATSGWFAQSRSDFDSEHIYFKLRTLSPGRRPLLVSECGGYTLALGEDDGRRKYGYGKCRDSEELTERILTMYREMILPAVPAGLCGCIYTQLSDIEGEINGLYTYDRQQCKVDPAPLAEMARTLRAEVQ